MLNGSVSAGMRIFRTSYSGLRAFVKYVPRDVVKMMLCGEMESSNFMDRKVLTILFMDIIGFSTLCEQIVPDQLMMVTAEYLQAMCEIIVSSRGTLDKVLHNVHRIMVSVGDFMLPYNLNAG